MSGYLCLVFLGYASVVATFAVWSLPREKWGCSK